MRNKNIGQAVQFAVDHETSWSRDVGDLWGIHQQDPPPWNRLLGPVHSRGPVTGTIVLQRGSGAQMLPSRDRVPHMYIELDKAEPTASYQRLHPESLGQGERLSQGQRSLCDPSQRRVAQTLDTPLALSIAQIVQSYNVTNAIEMTQGATAGKRDLNAN